MSRRKPRTWPDEPAPLAAPVMDNHTHLPVHEGEIPRADGVRLGLDEQIRRARAAGVVAQVSSACELPDFDPMIALARAHEGVRVALAIHPNEAALHAGCADPSPDGLTPRIEEHHVPLDEALAEVERRLDDPMVVAVGETGLDFYRTGEAGRDAQAESFRAHLRLAERAGLPLQIHDRDAHAETLGVLDEEAADDQPIVFHCYSGDAQMAERLARRGWYASFSGTLTYPANEDLRRALAVLPRDLVLVETDAPYLTPVPHRGSPNSSYVMAHTVRVIADLWGVDEAEACETLMATSRRVYGSW
ncbi:TatD family hydrolase [Actinomyces sp. B33]|uniref:TatD family hydrolase n=1 Tax=Actinomyces sp. B33 TaxID=2942131 RepID=UPI00233FAEF8|nr:TatD family hydrolase [Actinomyces sp. B33]MDC4233754.1 TatD family hydrolase [Actinomyces sp. B33]